MKKNHLIFLGFVVLLLMQGCTRKQSKEISVANIKKAEQTLDAIYTNYGTESSPLLRETYPFDSDLNVTYLASAEQAQTANEWSYLWPYSGSFSAVNTLLQATKDTKYKTLLSEKVLVGLEEYYDDSRTPAGYASYINSSSDRFYDDNVWLGIDFVEAYEETKEPEYLAKAKLIWDFVWSGHDDKLDGGIYWCEQAKNDKNTCSNAPGSVLALKLYMTTKEKEYLTLGTNLYTWTKSNLQDPEDHLYYDNINLNGKIDRAKYAYNSGQMIQAASLLYKITKDKKYLKDAELVAEASFNHFFQSMQSTTGDFMIVRKGDVWFTAVMFRGFVELYHLNQDAKYIEHFQKSLDYAWEHARDKDGLFSVDWTGEEKNVKKWLLTQAAMVEMYARIANI